ncbi:MAG: TlpA disulfide reductase family protein [Candidatus Eremiobacterota bacterium]
MRGWIALLVLAVLACGAPPQPAGSPAPLADPLSLKRLDGSKLDFRPPDRKLTLLVFWSCSWDPHALSEWRTLKRLDQAYRGQGLRILAVAYEEKPAALKKFLAGHPGQFDLAMGDAAAYEAYAVEALPTLVLVDSKGKILQRSEGVPDAPALEKSIREALP